MGTVSLIHPSHHRSNPAPSTDVVAAAVVVANVAVAGDEGDCDVRLLNHLDCFGTS